MLPCVRAFVNAFEHRMNSKTDDEHMIFFYNILSELHIDLISFRQIEYVYADDITGDGSYIDDINYRNVMYGLYDKMIKNIPETIEFQPFVAASLEVFPNKDKTGGHAITLIKVLVDRESADSDTEDREPSCENDDCYYIIDDHNAISRLDDYYKSRSERLYEIVIRDIDSINIANINRILRAKCSSNASFSNRVSRYVLNFDHKFLSGADIIADKASKIIESTREQVLERIDEQFNRIVGGNDKNMSFLDYMSDKWIVFIFGVLTGLVIMCIVVKRVCMKIHNETEKVGQKESFVNRFVKTNVLGYGSE
jgi:hypothetical protein